MIQSISIVILSMELNFEFFFSKNINQIANYHPKRNQLLQYEP